MVFVNKTDVRVKIIISKLTVFQANTGLEAVPFIVNVAARDFNTAIGIE